jgi:c-di-AMP phosphodiesterase-like protein
MQAVMGQPMIPVLSSKLAMHKHWKWSQLEGCVFVGHLKTDSDSIGSAIGAAALYGGTAARASEINLETKW